MKCDVLVVGAGPAGSMAAKTAAKMNANVILIERNRNIGQPVRCAEGINKFLFRDTGIKKDESYIRQVIDGTKLYFYNEVYELNSEQWKGYTIDRTIFDKHLALDAEVSGAELYTATKAVGIKKMNDRWLLKAKTENGAIDILAKIVIGADGFECNIGRWAGIRKKWEKKDICKCYELFLDCPFLNEANKYHIAFGEEFPNGYAWIFPKNKKANVGVGIHPKASTKEALSYFINDYPRIKNLIGRNYTIIEKRGGVIPITGPRDINETISDGIILVGDAAGIVDPITGEGISTSMISGISAGETASLCLKKKRWKKEDLIDYKQRWMNKQYINTTLGENMRELLELKDIFFNVFSDKKIKKSEREEFISMMKDLSEKNQ